MDRKNKILDLMLFIFFVFLPIDASLPKVPFIGSVINIIAILIIILLIINILNSKRIFRINRNIVYFYIYYVFSMFIGAQMGISLFSGTTFILYGLLVILLMSSNYKLNFIGIRNAFFVSTILILVYFIINRDILFTQRLYIDFGFKMDPNYFSANLILVNFVFLYYLMNRKNKFLTNILLVFSILIIFTASILTGSRGSMAGHLFLVLIFLFWKISLRNFLHLFIIFIFTFILFEFLLIPNMSNLIIGRFQLDSILTSRGTGRFDIWKSSVEIYKNSNFFRLIFGYGQGTSKLLTITAHANHNSWIQSVLEGGLFGLIIWLILMLSPIVFLTKNKEYNKLILFVSVILITFSLDFHYTRTFWLTIYFVYSKNFKF